MWRWPIGPQLPTADFCIKNETPDMKFFEKSFSIYLLHGFARKANPLWENIFEIPSTYLPQHLGQKTKHLFAKI
jgi:hypothetical protein